jgi:hypothetical protein
MSKLFKTKKASILGATLIILGIILVSALSFSLVSIQERKASSGANKSNQAFQTAGTGVELVMQAIKDYSGDKVTSLATAAGATCTGGVITNTTTGFKVQLQDSDGNAIDCGDNTKDVALVKSVKSVGTIGQNQRAVEVAVAAGTCKGGIVKIASTNSSNNFTAEQSSDLKDFVVNGDGKIVETVCISSSFGTHYENTTIGYFQGTGFFAGKFICSVFSGCSGGSGPYNCDGGWAVYGSCTCDNTCFT